MKKIINLSDYIFDEIISESVIYLSEDTVNILKKLRDIPENKWGAEAFVKSPDGNEFRKTSGAATDGKERYESGKYLKKSIIDKYIDSILDHNGEYISGNKHVFVDVVLKDNSLIAKMITDSMYKQLSTKGITQDYDLADDFLNGNGDSRNVYRLQNLYNDLELNTVTKVGRVLRGLKIESGLGEKIDDVIIEELSKKIHSFLLGGRFEEDLSKMDVVLEEVTGDDIIFWYNVNNYADPSMFSDTEGSLHGSCMKGQRCSNFFDIYASNPDQISMLVYYDNTDKKLFGRALIWKDSSGNKIMDKIYAINISTRHIFKKYEEKYCKGDFDEIFLEYTDFDYYPYMDTFYYINTETNGVANYDNGGEEARSVNGKLGEIAVDIHGNEIDFEHATYIEYAQGYAHNNEVSELDFNYETDTGATGEYALDVDIVEIEGKKYYKGDINIVQLSDFYYGMEEYWYEDKVYTEEIQQSYIKSKDAIFFLYYFDTEVSQSSKDLILRLGVMHEDVDNVEEYENMFDINRDGYDINKLIFEMLMDIIGKDIFYVNDENSLRYDKYDFKDKELNYLKNTNLNKDGYLDLNRILVGLLLTPFYMDENNNIVFGQFYGKDKSGDTQVKSDNSVLRLLMYLADGGTINDKTYLGNLNLFSEYEQVNKIMQALIKYKEENTDSFNKIKSIFDKKPNYL